MTSKRLTKTRVQALLSIAGRGEDELITFWQDSWQIDIRDEPDQIRQTVKDELWDAQTLKEALAARTEFLDYREARKILHARYVA